MFPAAQTPFISVENAQAALDSLGYASAPASPNPLERLMLVEQALADPSMPSSSLSREVILNRLLVDAIRDQLAQHRAAHGLPAPDEHLPLAQALDHLNADGRTSSQALIGWSILFHRYVCVTLGLSPDSLASALMITARTVQRYQVDAVRRLTKWLTEAEQAARHSQQQRRLIAQLPTQVPTTLVGLEATWATLSQLRDTQRPFHIAITGPHGIGKSTLAQEFIRALIEANQVDQLIWLDHPTSAEQTRQLITARLLPNDAQTTLRELLQVVRTVIVLDDVDALLVDASSLADLLNELSAALVFLLGVDDATLPVAHAHVVVPQLSEDEAVALTGLALAGMDEPAESVTAFGRAIWQAVGGNPLLIRLSATSRQFIDTLTSAPADALDRVYGQALVTLDATEVRTLAMVALCPPGEVALTQLTALWPDFSPDAVEALIRRSWIDRVSREQGTFVLVSAARRFLLEHINKDNALRVVIGSLLATLDQPRELSPSLRDELLYLLRQDDLSFPDGWRVRTMNRLVLADIPTVQRPYWHLILEQEQARAGTLDASLQIAYAVSLRRAADWSKAMDILSDVTRQAGMRGDFLDQARAMVELAVLYGYRGDYERARSMLVKAERTGRRYRDAALSERAQMELAQIHVDTSEGAVALQLLSDLPDTLRVLALRAEALFLSGDIERAVGQVEQAFALPNADVGTLARLRTILGRGFEAQGQLEQARNHFAVAVTLLEQANDPFALARAYNNLASSRIRLDLLPETTGLLRRAEAIQRALGDRVGLAATQHNQRLLSIRASR